MLELLSHENFITAMEFTESYKQTGPCCFSPNARFLAVAVDYRLVIRDVLSLKVFIKLYLSLNTICSFFFCFLGYVLLGF